MTLDKLMQRVEQKIAGQSALMQVASIWMAKTDGRVSDSITIDEDSYMHELQQLPLWNLVSERLQYFSGLLQRTVLRGILQEDHATVHLLRHFPGIVRVLEHFLADYDYFCEGKFGSPRNMQAVLRDYDPSINNGEGGYRGSQGMCKNVAQAMRHGSLTPEQILQQLGFQARWDHYQSTRGIPRKFRSVAKKVLEDFLFNPDYSEGDSYSKFADPKSLTSVLDSYVCTENQGEGKLKSHQGDAKNVRSALREGKMTEEGLLDAINLKGEWEFYQSTRGLPKKWRDIAQTVIEEFLADPDYCFDRYNGFGSPKSLATILRDLSPKEGMNGNNGKCRELAKRITNKEITSEDIINFLGLQERWDAYQATRGIPKKHKDVARHVLTHFLRNPDYCYNDGHNNFGDQKSVAYVLKNYDPELSRGKGGNQTQQGPALKVAHPMSEGHFSEDKLLQELNLTPAWQQYQTSRGIPRELRDLAEITIDKFLKHPQYCDDARNPKGAPKQLKTVLRDFQATSKRGKFIGSRGTAVRVYRAILRGDVSEERILNVVRLDRQWADYQNSNGANPFVYRQEVYKR